MPTRITAAQLADEVAEAKRRDGRSDVLCAICAAACKNLFKIFWHLPIAGITLDELDQECETCPIALRCASAESRTGAQRLRVGHPIKTTKSQCERRGITRAVSD